MIFVPRDVAACHSATSGGRKASVKKAPVVEDQNGSGTQLEDDLVLVVGKLPRNQPEVVVELADLVGWLGVKRNSVVHVVTDLHDFTRRWVEIYDRRHVLEMTVTLLAFGSDNGFRQSLENFRIFLAFDFVCDFESID